MITAKLRWPDESIGDRVSVSKLKPATEQDWVNAVQAMKRCLDAGRCRLLPKQWETDGNSPQLFQVNRFSAEFEAVSSSLSARIAEYGLSIMSVERQENASLWGKYKLERDDVEKLAGDANELWLWHGTSALDDVLAHGFNIAYASLENNVYGVGICRLHLHAPPVFIICKRQVFTLLRIQLKAIGLFHSVFSWLLRGEKDHSCQGCMWIHWETR